MVEFLKRATRKWPMRLKFGLLMFLVHLDPAFRKSYIELSKRLSSNQGRTLTTEEAELVFQAGYGNVPEVWWWVKILRFVTNTLHCVNTVKVFLLILTLNDKLIPVEYNCYLPGRFSAHETLIEYLPFLGLYFSILNVVWRYLTQISGCNYEMDLMVFLLFDEQKINEEIKRANSYVDLAHSWNEIAQAEPLNSIIGRVLFYKVVDSKLTFYKLRPNRKDKSELEDSLNLTVFCLIGICVVAGIMVIPFMVLAIFPDPNYIRSYPTCCPELESLSRQGKLEYWRVSRHLCGWHRLQSITFDVIENFFILFDSVLNLIVPLGISILVSRDLMHYWRSIARSVSDLADSFRSEFDPNIISWNRTKAYIPSENIGSVLLRGSPPFQREAPLGRRFLEEEDGRELSTVELQAQLCDFFACLGRQNRLVNMLISFSVFLFCYFILTIGYLALKMHHWWSLLITRFAVCLVYAVFFSGSMLLLQLKGAIDGSYVELCALMARDRSRHKRKWAQILDNYWHTKRNSFTIFNDVQLGWALLLNLAASSVSFLAVIETYKYQWS